MFKKLSSFIKAKSKDAIWAGVFVAIITGILGSVATLVWSLLNNVTFQKALKELFSFLQNNELHVNFLTIGITVFLLLIILITLFKLRIIIFRTRHLRRVNLNSKNFNIHKFLNGLWICEWTSGTPTNHTQPGVESVKIKDGTKYYAGQNMSLLYFLTAMKIEEGNSQISWNKTRNANGAQHSRETLRITSYSELTGTDDNGLIIKYTRLGQ